MNNELKVVVCIVLVNALVALVYLGWSLFKKDYKKSAMMTLFILLAPVVGPLYLGLSALLYQVYFKNRTAILSMEDLSFRKEKVKWIEKEDLKSAANKVPIEEALLVSDVHSTRRLILNVLKDDTEEYVRSIKQATANADSEVSHYAATAITDIMNTFKQEEKKLRQRYEANPTNERIVEQYWLHLHKFLENGVLPRVEQERYFEILEQLTLYLEDEIGWIVTGEKYYKLTLMSLDMGKLDQAQMWVEKALTRQQQDLHSYKAGLKYYYESHNVEQYKKLLEELKASTIRFDHETLELIRFYSQ